MSLNRKILVWLLGSLAVLLPVCLVVSSVLVLGSFAEAERKSVARSLGSLAEVIAAEGAALEVMAVDWGAWDDTYDYAATRSAEFEQANFSGNAFANLRVNVALFADAKGETLYGTGYNPKANGLTKLPAGLAEEIKRGALAAWKSGKPVSGILPLPEGHLMLAGHPILKTDESGPVRGVVVFGRWMDEAMIRRFERIVSFPVTLAAAAAEDDAGADFAEARRVFVEGARQHQVEMRDGSLAAFTLLRDVQGRSSLIARMVMPREIYEEGRLSIWNLVVSLLITALVFGLVVLVAVRRIVVDRLQTMADGVGRIRAQQDLSLRVARTGGDEIGRLTDAVNGMLEALEKSEAHQVRVDAALELEKERLAVTLRSLGEGVVATDVAGNVVLMNKTGEEMTGWSARESAGLPVWKVFRAVDSRASQPLQEIISDVIASGRPYELPSGALLVSRNGMELGVAGCVTPVVDVSAKILGSVLVFRDTTAAQRIEAERMRANKLESVGLLAGGIAHDFNNALTAILSNNMLATLSAGSDPELKGYLADTEKACIRARSLTQQLLTFARGGAPVRKPADVGGLLHEAGSFAVRGSNVRCKFDIEHGLMPAEVDEGQIVQVIQNLVINAVQAMPEGGTVYISARNETVFDARDGLQCGPHLFITVRDEGTGISAENLSKIFDPYFTTKRRGSGLGLATAYAIIRNHGGLIAAESSPGHGATFVIHLPALASEPQASAAAPSMPPSASGRVLLMDDDEVIQGALKNVLGKLGSFAAVTSDGQAAVDAYADALKSGTRFDFVILDLMVPAGMGGLEAAQKILLLDPTARIIVSSGYSNDPVMANYEQHGFAAVLPKPFTITDLTSVLRDITKSPAEFRQPGQFGH